MDSTPLPCQTETVVSIDSKASGVTRKQRQCSKNIAISPYGAFNFELTQITKE
ncbi:hypothetical protein YC2023_083758 [Brassica napus]